MSMKIINYEYLLIFLRMSLPLVTKMKYMAKNFDVNNNYFIIAFFPKRYKQYSFKYKYLIFVFYF